MRYINKKMIIIGFVVAVMIFSSFAIVFNNLGNTSSNNSNKQILNLPEKSFTSNVVNKYQIELKIITATTNPIIIIFLLIYLTFYIVIYCIWNTYSFTYAWLQI